MKNVHWEPGVELDIYDFLVNPVDKCNAGKDNIILLVLVKSAPGHTERRNATRQTYIGGAAKFNVSMRLLYRGRFRSTRRERKHSGRGPNT